MDSFYQILLAIHNILRWIIVIFALTTIVTTCIAVIGKKPWDNRLSKFGLFYTISLDTQLLIGLLLYFVFSPLTKAFFSDIGTAMSNATLRFFGMEHFLIMLIAAAFAHIGNSSGIKDLPDEKKLRRAAIFYTISFLLILGGIPWASRPLFPGL